LRHLEKTLGSARHRALVSLLVAKRGEAGLTQVDLAKQLGEHQSFVARLESGQRRIDVVEFLKLAELLKFDPASAIEAVRRAGFSR
jgi:transcriptional regulator with XRE-family HTH domain